MKDTNPKILERWYASLDALSPEERVKMTCSMYDFARAIVEASIRNESPAISERDLARKSFIRFYSKEFDQKTLERILVAFDGP